MVHKTPAGKSGHKYTLVYNTNEVLELVKLLKPYLRPKKLLDFQLALALYYTHSPEVTVLDLVRIAKLDKKKEMRRGKTPTQVHSDK